MYKNQYDTDVITWSPQGRLFQVEYAMEAVKQGSASVGVTSRNYAVLASLKRCVSRMLSVRAFVWLLSTDQCVCWTIWSSIGRGIPRLGTALAIGFIFNWVCPAFVTCRSPSELAGFQEKTFVIDDHIGISISGLTSDARSLCKYVAMCCVGWLYVDVASPAGTCARRH
jgi:20S proteasome alpha/beta subunit